MWGLPCTIPYQEINEKPLCRSWGRMCTHTNFSCSTNNFEPQIKKMKSTKVQNPRRTSRTNNEWLLAMPRGVAVLPGQFLLLCWLAASVCLVWGKAEPATCPSTTILYGALNGKTATSNQNSRQLRLTHLPHVDIVGHALYNIHGWQGGNPNSRQFHLTHVAHVDIMGHGQYNIHGWWGGWVTKLYAWVLFIIDGFGHAIWSSMMLVSRSQTVSF